MQFFALGGDIEFGQLRVGLSKADGILQNPFHYFLQKGAALGTFSCGITINPKRALKPVKNTFLLRVSRILLFDSR